MQLFYNSDLNEFSTLVSFEAEESRHIAKVLRKTIGDTLHITNGNGYLFEAKITMVDHRKCGAEIFSFIKIPKKEYQLHLAVAPTKNNDRYEWFLEKAIEIGIDEITPIICERSERKIIKKERMLKVIQAAMKQSLQTYHPIVNEAMSFKEFLKKNYEGQRFIGHCEEDEKNELNQLLVPKKDVIMLIGPEGDFTTSEITMAIENKFAPVALGANRLRTETAALVACTMVMAANIY